MQTWAPLLKYKHWKEQTRKICFISKGVLTSIQAKVEVKISFPRETSPRELTTNTTHSNITRKKTPNIISYRQVNTNMWLIFNNRLLSDIKNSHTDQIAQWPFKIVRALLYYHECWEGGCDCIFNVFSLLFCIFLVYFQSWMDGCSVILFLELFTHCQAHYNTCRQHWPMFFL